MNYVEAPSFAILVNGVLIKYFRSMIELCQGYPFSIYLFILCIDAFSHALRATVQGSTLELY